MNNRNDGADQAPQSTPASYVDFNDDYLRVMKPLWMSEVQWVDLARIADRRFEEIVDQVRSQR